MRHPRRTSRERSSDFDGSSPVTLQIPVRGKEGLVSSEFQRVTRFPVYTKVFLSEVCKVGYRLREKRVRGCKEEINNGRVESETFV